jgi:hypothetical protein
MALPAQGHGQVWQIECPYQQKIQTARAYHTFLNLVKIGQCNTAGGARLFLTWLGYDRQALLLP